MGLISAEACCGCRGALAGQDAVVAEVELMQKVIGTMVEREGTLVVMQVPAQREGEEREAYVVRKEKERVLILNPSYRMEKTNST
jgi:hypothetical protein